jgi:hypothetical protein
MGEENMQDQGEENIVMNMTAGVCGICGELLDETHDEGCEGAIHTL